MSETLPQIGDPYPDQPKLELRPHPSRRLNRITGQMEPHIRDVQALYLDGYLIGYCGAVQNRPITLIRYYDRSERDAIFSFVAEKGLRPTRVACPPKPEVPEPAASELWLPGGDDE